MSCAMHTGPWDACVPSCWGRREGLRPYQHPYTHPYPNRPDGGSRNSTNSAQITLPVERRTWYCPRSTSLALRSSLSSSSSSDSRAAAVGVVVVG